MNATKRNHWKEGQAPLALLAIAVMIAAGCLTGTPTIGTDEGDDPSAPAFNRPGVGHIEGRVLDEEALPVAGADVLVDGRGLSDVTSAAGHFRIADVPAGEQLIRVFKDGYEPGQATVVVPADGTARAEIVLVVLPSFEPHRATHIFEGHYDCAHEVPIWTGDCMLLYESVMNESDPYTSETYRFQFDVEPRWQTFVMELVWEGSANNQLEGMRFYLEHVTDVATDHSVKVGRADGDDNPLRFTVNRSEPHPRADTDPDTGEPATFPANGSAAQVRVFPHGRFYDESCTIGQIVFDACTLGVGAGVDIKFTVYATVFYNEPAPTGFTAVPDA